MNENPQEPQAPLNTPGQPSRPDFAPVDSDAELRSGKYLPQGQGYAPPQSAPPHPHDAYTGFRPQAQPGYYQPGYGQARYIGAPPPPGYGPRYVPQKPHSGRAIACLVLGIFNFVLIFVTPITAPVGLVLGFLALKDTKPEGPLQGRGFAVAGLWINGIALLGCVVLGIGIGAVIVAANAERTERVQSRVTGDFDTIRARLHRYYTLNKDSLGPGGPVLTANVPDGEKVRGTLKLGDIVSDRDLAGSLYEFELTINGKAGARVVHRSSGREMVVSDIAQDLYVVTPGR